jgi:hypothetical protein
VCRAVCECGGCAQTIAFYSIDEKVPIHYIRRSPWQQYIIHQVIHYLELSESSRYHYCGDKVPTLGSVIDSSWCITRDNHIRLDNGACGENVHGGNISGLISRSHRINHLSLDFAYCAWTLNGKIYVYIPKWQNSRQELILLTMLFNLCWSFYKNYF